MENRELLRRLISFRDHERPAYAARVADLTRGQQPKAVFIGCADSRLMPGRLLGAEPGELFIVRNVGNLVPPRASPTASASGDDSVGAALEFALGVLEVRDVIVCGHSNCGAMQARLSDPAALAKKSPSLARWLEHTKPSESWYRNAVEKMAESAAGSAGVAGAASKGEAGADPDGLEPADRLSQINVLQQLQHLRSYPVVNRREDAGELTVHGWWFEIATASVWVWDEMARSFVEPEEAWVEPEA